MVEYQRMPFMYVRMYVCMFFKKILFIYLTERSQVGREAGRERYSD